MSINLAEVETWKDSFSKISNHSSSQLPLILDELFAYNILKVSETKNVGKLERKFVIIVTLSFWQNVIFLLGNSCLERRLEP